MKFAVIDIGSNTVKADLYKYKDGKLELQEKYIERDMIADHKDGGVLDRSGADILINIMNGFKRICLDKGITKIFPYATQSLRGISNADEVLKSIKAYTGLDVVIISGKEEARLCFESFSAESGVKDGVLSDMGGGSTELNFIKNGELVKSVSLPFGARSLTHDIKINIIPDKNQKKEISAIIDKLKKEYELPSGYKDLYACGGTSSGMFKLFCERTKTKKKSADVTDIFALYNELASDPDAAAKIAFEIIPERYDTVFTGVYAHIYICRILGIEKINHCKSTCRKGYAAKLIRDGYIK